MSSDILSVWNAALGDAQISARVEDIDENSVQAQTIRTYYDIVRKTACVASFWPSSGTENRLTRIAERDFASAWQPSDPSTEYQYSYVLPADCLRPRYLTSFAPFRISMKTDKVTQILSTNEELPILQFSFDQVLPALWDMDLYEAITVALAARISGPLNSERANSEQLLSHANGLILKAREMLNLYSEENYDWNADWIQARGYAGSRVSPRYIAPFGALFPTKGNI